MQTAPLRACQVATFVFLIALSVPLARATTSSIDEGPYLLRLERGDSLRIVRLEPATFGMFRYVRTDSIEGYLSWHKVRALTNAQGVDVTRDVMERRRAIGVDPLLYRREGSSELRRRHRSRREDRTFGIFEAGYYTQAGGPKSTDDVDVMVSADVGALRNLSQSFAAGGVLHLEADDDRTGFGIGLRGRRWLNNTFSVDGGAGWMFAGDDDRGEFKGGAFFGEAAINFGDHLQLVASIESWRFARYRYRYGFPDSIGYLAPESLPYTGVTKFPAERETRIHVGAKTGRYPGIVLMMVVGFMALANQAARDY